METGRDHQRQEERSLQPHSRARDIAAQQTEIGECRGHEDRGHDGEPQRRRAQHAEEHRHQADEGGHAMPDEALPEVAVEIEEVEMDADRQSCEERRVRFSEDREHEQIDSDDRDREADARPVRRQSE